MNSQPIYTSVWRVSMVWRKIEPYCVDNTRTCWIQHIECLRIALLKIIWKFCEEKHLFSINYRICITPLQPTGDPAVFGSTWSIICNTLLKTKLSVIKTKSTKRNSDVMNKEKCRAKNSCTRGFKKKFAHTSIVQCKQHIIWNSVSQCTCLHGLTVSNSNVVLPYWLTQIQIPQCSKKKNRTIGAQQRRIFYINY